MKEEFLHYVWKLQFFNRANVQLNTGEKLEIVHPGILNSDSGPDFFNAQIKIDNTIWAGNIEIHVNSSDWISHKHHRDEAYDKVILHVVWNNDKEIKRKSGEIIQCLELKGLVQKSVLDNYKNLQRDFDQIPCEKSINGVDSIIIESFLERVLIERLENKSKRFDLIFKLNANDWEASLYQLLAKYFGFKVNAVPFELLASSLPITIIRKHAHNLTELEALLFGQAGFLEQDYRGSYPNKLQKEYRYLRHKYRLKPISKSLWKFMRMRPVNFPTIRIAQLAALLNKHKSLLQLIIEAQDISKLKALFKVEASEYWHSHYQFDVPASKRESKNMGDRSIDLLLINTIIPLLFSYGKKQANEEIGEKLITLLRNLKPEQNKVINEWKQLGIQVSSALESQGLLQLRTSYCDLKKCLTCSIGNSIIKSNRNDHKNT